MWQDKLANAKMHTPFCELDIWQYMLDKQESGNLSDVSIFDYLESIGFVKGSDFLTVEQCSVLRSATDIFFSMLKQGTL